MMYAIFQSGGKQHRASEGQKIRMEKLDIATEEEMELDKVLMIVKGENIKIGDPFVEGGKIHARVVAHSRKKKVKIVKFRRRKNQHKKKGHRQWFTEIKIISIKD